MEKKEKSNIVDRIIEIPRNYNLLELLLLKLYINLPGSSERLHPSMVTMNAVSITIVRIAAEAAELLFVTSI